MTRLEDIAFCLITAGFLQKTGQTVSNLIKEVMNRSPPMRVTPIQLLFVRKISVLALLIRATVNIIFYIFTKLEVNPEKNHLEWSFVTFLFYFLLEDVPLMVLMTLVHAQKGEKERVRRETQLSRDSLVNPSELSETLSD